jgi:quercetin dioxygenase-like cupin family protein
MRMRAVRTDVEERQTISGGDHIMSLNLRNTVLIVAATLVAQASALAVDAPFVQSGKEVKWGAPPPVFPSGAKFAVIAGDPAATSLVTVRFDMPAGYTIPPHFHPTDEHITVLKGSLTLGMGDVIDKTHTLTLSPGGYGVAVANMHHYAYTTTGATIQVHLQGPFAITYVNAADDPSKQRP